MLTTLWLLFYCMYCSFTAMSVHAQYPRLQAFLDYLKFEKRYSQNTILSYETDLLQFYKYLEREYGELALDQMSPPVIKSWLADLRDKKQAARSINRKISTLKSFFKFALRKEWIKQSPAANLIIPKMEKKLPQFVEQGEMETLLNDVEFADDARGKAEKLMLILLYQCGLRVSELVSLKILQVDFSYCHVKVLGKGNKERIIPLQSVLLTQLKNYISESHEGADGDRYIFLNKKDKPFSRREVYDIVKRNLASVTTIRKKSPHILRHSFATHLANNGADINAVKELLGHSSLAATQVYVHNNIEKLKQAYKTAHPKA